MNAELPAVDERIVGTKPKTLGFAEAAGFPSPLLRLGNSSSTPSQSRKVKA